jgi:DNA-binding NtrC family response regulator
MNADTTIVFVVDDDYRVREALSRLLSSVGLQVTKRSRLCASEEPMSLLASHFVRKFAERLGKPIPQIPDDGMAALTNHDWPGNIRELQNFIERAAIMTTGTA